MSTTMRIELTCPICDFHFTSLTLESRSEKRRKHTDFQLEFDRSSPAAYNADGYVSGISPASQSGVRSIGSTARVTS